MVKLVGEAARISGLATALVAAGLAVGSCAPENAPDPDKGVEVVTTIGPYETGGVVTSVRVVKGKSGEPGAVYSVHMVRCLREDDKPPVYASFDTLAEWERRALAGTPDDLAPANDGTVEVPGTGVRVACTFAVHSSDVAVLDLDLNAVYQTVTIPGLMATPPPPA